MAAGGAAKEVARTNRTGQQGGYGRTGRGTQTLTPTHPSYRPSTSAAKHSRRAHSQEHRREALHEWSTGRRRSGSRPRGRCPTTDPQGRRRGRQKFGRRVPPDVDPYPPSGPDVSTLAPRSVRGTRSLSFSLPPGSPEGDRPPLHRVRTLLRLGLSLPFRGPPRGQSGCYSVETGQGWGRYTVRNPVWSEPSPTPTSRLPSRTVEGQSPSGRGGVEQPLVYLLHLVGTLKEGSESNRSPSPVMSWRLPHSSEVHKGLRPSTPQGDRTTPGLGRRWSVVLDFRSF